MHYITTRLRSILGLSLILLSTNPAFAQQDNDNTVYYRASDGSKLEIYTIGTDRNFLRRVVDNKISVWTSFMRCEQFGSKTFIDPLFTSDKSTYTVNADCSMTIKDLFFEYTCPSYPVAVMAVLDNFKNQVSIGYGVEHLAPQEREYINKLCK